MSDLLKQFGIEMVPGDGAPAVDPSAPAPADAAPAPAPAAIDPAMGAQNALGGAQMVLDKLGAVAKDIGVSATEIPHAVAHGAFEAGRQVVTAGKHLVNDLSDKLHLKAMEIDRYIPLGQIDLSNPLKPEWKPGVPEKNSLRIPDSVQVGEKNYPLEVKNFVPKPTAVGSGMIDGVSQFITSYALGGKLLRMLGIGTAPATVGGKMAVSAVQTAFAGAAGFDPAEHRLSNLIQQNSLTGDTLANPINDFLSAKPDDSEAVGRLKNALEQVLMNGPIEAVFYGLQGIKAKRLGDLKAAEESAKLAEDSFNLWREQHADARGEVLDRGGSGLPAPAKVDVDALEAAQQGGMYGAPGTVVPEGQTLQGVEPKAPAAPAAPELAPAVRRADGTVEPTIPGTPVAEGEQGFVTADGKFVTPQEADALKLPAAPVEAPPTALPRDLSGAKPRYNYGSKGFGLEFESDVEKALFITSQKSKSARDADYRDWLKKVGYSDEEINTLGQVVRDNIKARAAQELGDTLSIGQIVERPGKNTDGTRVAPKESLPQAPVFDQQNLLDTFVLARGHYGWNLDTFSGSIIGKNMARVNNENDAKAFFNVLGVVEERAFAAAQGRPRTHAEIIEHAQKQLAQLADYTGVDVRELTARMAADNETLNQLATRVAGYRMATEVYSKRASELARQVIRGDASEFGGSLPALQAEFLKTAQTLLAIAPLTEGVKSGLGRNLSLLAATIGPGKEKVGSLAGIMDTGAKPPRPGEAPKVGPDGAPLAPEASTVPGSPGAATEAAIAGDLARALEGGAGDIQKLAQKLALADNPKVAKKIVDDAFGPSLMDVHNSIWINGLLSGPQTHVVNLLSSLGKSLVVMPTEQVLAGMFRSDKAMVRMAADQFVGFYLSIQDAWRVTGQAMKVGDAILDSSATSLGRQPAALTAETLGLQYDTPLGRLVEGLGKTLNLPGRLLTTEDEFLKQLNYRARLYSMAMREARAAKAAHADTDVAAYVKEYMDRGFDEYGRAINEEALAYAREATFTNDLKAKTWGWTGSKTVGESIHTFANNHPIFRPILTFTRVPTNILRDAWDHTPGMNLLRAQFREELNAGGERAAMAWAKMSTGMALLATATTMAINGDITGGLGDNAKVTDVEKGANKLPYSIRRFDENGNEYFIQYNRLDPVGIILGSVANLVEASKHLGDWEIEEIGSSMIIALAKNLESKSYFQNAANVFGALADPGNKLENWARRQAASYVPSVTNTFKGPDYLRDPHTITEAMLARTRGQDAVDPKFNLVGEKVRTPTALGPEWLSPFAMSREGGVDPTMNEVARLMQVHRSESFGPMPKKIGNVDLTTIHLGDRTAYARLQELSGEIKLGGMTLRERLTDLFNSDRYKNVLTDGDSTYDGSRLYHTQALVQGYREAAKAALQKEHPPLKAAIDADSRLQNETLKFGKQPH